MRHNRKVFIVTTALILVCPFSAANASPTAVQNSLTQVTSGMWSVVATPTGTTPGTGPLVLAWTVTGGSARQFFDFVNTGTLDVTGELFRVTHQYDRASGNVKPPTVSFDACVGAAFNQATNTCAGTLVPLGSTNSELNTTLTFLLPVGARLAVRATSNPGAISSYTTTVNVDINRSHVRNPAAINQ